MSRPLALIADIGGTNARFALTDPAAASPALLRPQSLREQRCVVRLPERVKRKTSPGIKAQGTGNTPAHDAPTAQVAEITHIRMCPEQFGPLIGEGRHRARIRLGAGRQGQRCPAFTAQQHQILGDRFGPVHRWQVEACELRMQRMPRERGFQRGVDGMQVAQIQAVVRP